MHNLMKFHRFVHKLLSGNRTLTFTKGHNSVVNLQKWMHNIPNLDLVKANAYSKFYLIPLTYSQDTEWKQKSDINQGL